MSTEDAAARGWIILEHWPVGLVARRLGSRAIQYLTHRRSSERLAWHDRT